MADICDAPNRAGQVSWVRAAAKDERDEEPQ
jgi:hypothetical protein